LLAIGQVVKPHGLDGEVVVDLWSDWSGRLVDGARFTVDGGTLTVTSVRPHQGRYLVRFEGVAGRDGAESVRGAVLRAAPVEVPGVLWVHELVGAEVVSV
jgi:16S rRNA processing protein RimM